MDKTLPSSEVTLSPEIAAFLKKQGMAPSEVSPLAGGANNRVYRVRVPGGADSVLKCYFQGAGDQRDRFGAERAFYESVWSLGLRSTPEPIAWEPQARLGLFSFISGRKLSPNEVDSHRVREAMQFVGRINANVEPLSARPLPVGSEACFSIQEHLECVDRRVARLERIGESGTRDPEALVIAREQLGPVWRSLRSRIVESALGGGLSLDATLPEEKRWLSPSDFGFHNALLAEDGRLRFFDFEYAGWDDPAKLVCDFFCQPELPAPYAMWSEFLECIEGSRRTDCSFSIRARLLFPAYQAKWCCIILNDFVRDGGARRAFAFGAPAAGERRRAQLDKARKMLAAMGSV